MLITFIRTILIYGFVIFAIRIMGKRQIGELEPSELVVTIIISEVAAMPIQDTSQPVILSVVAIVLLLILEVIISFVAYKSRGFRKILYGTPSILYSKGKINQKEMERQRFNVNDLMEIIRNNGAASLSEVDYVIVETNGNVSVLLNAENKTVTTKDLGIESAPVEISYLVIDNGKENETNLKRIGFDLEWLKTQLKEHSVTKIEDVYCMGADRLGNIFIIRKEEKL
ncbi:MAG: DUF421 domain-containing protein [Clostridia bacterium]|nr:DUF421 domain-containing protein [Clostridia bacterium]